MICPNCQFQNDLNAKFCGKCGSFLMPTASGSAIPIVSRKPLLGVEELFKSTWVLYQKANPNLLLIGLITVAAWTVWKLMVVPAILAVFGLGALATGNLSLGISVGLVGLAVLLLTWIVVFEIGFWGSAAGIVALEAAEKKETLKLGEIYSRAKSLLWPLSIVSLLVFLVVGLGLIFLILPGLILGFLLSFANFVVVCEEKNGFDALSQSLKLIWPHFWGILGRDLLILLAVGLVNIIFSKMLFFNLVSQIVILPFVLTYHYLIYKQVVNP